MLHEQPLLRIHRRRLGGRYSKCSIVDEAALEHKAAVAHAARNGLGQNRLRSQVPTCNGHLCDGVAARSGHVSHGTHIRRSRREQCTHATELHLEPGRADIRHQATRRAKRLRGRGRLRWLDYSHQLPCRRMVEDQSARQPNTVANSRLQLVAQLDSSERVDASLHQRRICVHRGACSLPNQL